MTIWKRNRGIPPPFSHSGGSLAGYGRKEPCVLSQYELAAGKKLFHETSGVNSTYSYIRYSPFHEKFLSNGFFPYREIVLCRKRYLISLWACAPDRRFEQAMAIMIDGNLDVSLWWYQLGSWTDSPSWNPTETAGMCILVSISRERSRGRKTEQQGFSFDPTSQNISVFPNSVRLNLNLPINHQRRIRDGASSGFIRPGCGQHTSEIQYESSREQWRSNEGACVSCMYFLRTV